jgi:uncharacterized protein YbaR (Trm112 family)
MAVLDKKLLAILACPLTKAPVILDGERLVSTDGETRRAYRIVEGIPNMLIDESEVLSPEEHRQIMEKHGVAKPAPAEKPSRKRKKAS